MAYTEFHCDFATGANINAGDNKTVVTSTNGAWSTVTNIFTATGGTPFSGVSAGDFASVYTDGATPTTYIARVVSVGGGGLTLTLSGGVVAGVAPTTAATGISCTTGGKWKGPNGASGFPFTLSTLDLLTDSTGRVPRINVKNTSNYAVTAAITTPARANIGFVIEGYTATPGDGGRFVIDGGTSGASYDLFTLSTSLSQIRHAIFQNNGATGNSNGLTVSTNGNVLYDASVNSVRGVGVYLNGGDVSYAQGEVYGCNQSNSAGMGGVYITSASNGNIESVYSHDNAGSNSFGFRSAAGFAFFDSCIADTNGGVGFFLNAGGTGLGVSVTNCDSYNNGSDGLSFGGNNGITLNNSIFYLNGGFGVDFSGNPYGVLLNCAFGANTSGAVSTPTVSSVVESGTVTLSADPFTSAAAGDFSLNTTSGGGAACRAAGYPGVFPGGVTTGYIDIGAVQHQDSGGGGGATPYVIGS